MKLKECTKDTAYYPSVEEFHKLQKTKGRALYAVSRVVKLFLKLFKIREKDFYGICKYYEIGDNWGGLEMGDFFICGRNSSENLKCHELGHGLQNANVGGISMLLHSIGSAIRYWYREIVIPKTSYDDWWFEGNATQLGHTYLEKILHERSEVENGK